MFEEAMSGSQLLDEYYADLSDIQVWTLRFHQSEYVRRYLWKRHKKCRTVISKEHVTPRGNRYLSILFYEQSGAGKNRQWEVSPLRIGLMETRRGLCTIAFHTDNHQAIRYTSHFFERYRERYIKICDWQVRNRLMAAKTIAEIAAIYMERNLSMVWIETASVFRDKVHIFGPVNDGVVLLQWSNGRKLLQANTFVTEDMLDETQLKMVGYARAYLEMSPDERAKYDSPDFAKQCQYDNK